MDRLKFLKFCGMSAPSEEKIVTLGVKNNKQESSPLELNGATEKESVIPTDNLADQVVVRLKPENVRWFYKSCTDKLWIPFRGHDSLKLENIYRQLAANGVNIVNNWQKSSPCPSTTGLPLDSPLLTYSISSTESRNFTNPQVHSKVTVRGSMYEVDMYERTCTAIYWEHDSSLITRGSWFFNNWQPIEVTLSLSLENSFIDKFGGKTESQLNEENANKKILYSDVFDDYIVDWYTHNEVYLYQKTKLVRTITQKIGGFIQKSTGSKLLRGYKILATDADRPNDISHMVFVVHGAGQKIEIGGRILRNTSNICHSVASLQRRIFPLSTERAEFFPIEWRMSLTLDEGLIESITPITVVQLRQFLNSTVMDIMYYTSPLYKAEIQQSVISELNRIYTEFVTRNPKLADVKVSIIGHSLGSVIIYDIFDNQICQGQSHSAPCSKECLTDVNKSKLKFQMDKFFCLGSPLAVFLALRYPRGCFGAHLFPSALCNRVYNIFHSADPVAYRLEPLIVREYSQIAPLKIKPYTMCYSNMPYNSMPIEFISTLTKDVHSNESVEIDEHDLKSKTNSRSSNIWNYFRSIGTPSSASGKNQSQLVLETENLIEHRLDYVLRPPTATMSYLSAITSHNSYWSNLDVGLFLLTQLFPSLEQNTQFNSNSGLENSNSYDNATTSQCYGTYEEETEQDCPFYKGSKEGL